MTSEIDTELWKKAAQDIDWFVEPTSVLGSRPGPNPYTWFPDGKLNTCYNCLDRHVASLGDQACLIWDSSVTNTKQVYTYRQVLDRVQTLAGVFHSYGLHKGDTVLIYMPMVPEAVFAFLACARLGVVHSAVFGGFAPKELAKRIDACKPKVVLTASCGIEPKRVIPYKPLLEEALRLANHHVPIRLLLQRERQRSLMNYAQGDRDFDQEMARIETNGKQFKGCVSVKSEDPLYVLYTSGTTGVPKGVVRTNGGHAVVLRWSIDYVFNIKRGDTIFTASDIGWAVSHSYTVYGPMLIGATTILYEGKPIASPDAGTFWRLISDYKVKTMFTAPTAVRAIAREDPHALLSKQYDLSSLTSLFLAGERSDPETLKWCQNLVHKTCTVIDNYWSTELGSPVTATCAGHLQEKTREGVRWGSAGKQVPGSRILVLKEGTLEEATEANQFGNIVLKLPLPPGAFPGLWQNEAGYKSSYFDKYPGYFDTGDAGMIDQDGFVHIMSRTDDIINVAGHRLSTGTIEQILIAHPMVAECCVVPLPDKLKGHVPLGILVLTHEGQAMEADVLFKELVQATRRDLGAIACFEISVIVPRLPKTRSGKVLRRSIREMVDGKQVNMPATIEDEDTLYEIYDILSKRQLIPLDSPLLLKAKL
ncbi:uncharacterized protein EV154DRAFT_521656 [Mucor mucedo]|uniref:uncharacterized protein n=1 Tax=Mucor mucedo TaxID=29922 RepID=UPI00221F86DF|nr:uncharacterized protein EV154DRAFT_521656 [Mucor mucedo]KAI7885967.1 hypothetical protein EV154DRAFT_521656 [Mucor mucedo]